jgi:hypothetical protein
MESTGVTHRFVVHARDDAALQRRLAVLEEAIDLLNGRILDVVEDRVSPGGPRATVLYELQPARRQLSTSAL